MSHELGNKEKIYQLLQKEPLTSEEIAEKLKINEDPEKNIQFIRTYLQRLIKANLIKSNEKKGRYQVYTTIKRESNDKTLNLLKELYEFMSNEVKCELKKINESDIGFLTKIKERIQ